MSGMVGSWVSVSVSVWVWSENAGSHRVCVWGGWGGYFSVPVVNVMLV